MVGLATALLLLCWIFLSSPFDSVAVAHPTNVEEQKASVDRAGSGEIRYAVDVSSDNGKPDDAPKSPAKALKVKSEGLFTDQAQYWLVSFCDGIISEANQKLNQVGVLAGSSEFQVAVDQLDALKDIYVYSAMKELVASGSYITFTAGQFPPPAPDGCMTIRTTQYPLQNGKEGHAVFWIDTRYRRELQEIYESLKETRAAARWERIRSWNERPEAERQSEIEEYLQLSAKAMDEPTANLTSVEFARYWRMRLLLLELNAEVVHGRSFLFERSGGQPR